MKTLVIIALCLGLFNGSTNAEKLKKFEKSANEMSLDLLKVLLETQTGNFISSPFGVSQLLMILSTGSQGETKRQLEKALHVKPADTFKHGALDFTSKWDKSILNMANKIYMNERYTIRKKFMNNIVAISNKKNPKEIFGFLNFENATYSAKVMNQWVEKQTNNKIKDFIQADDISENTYLHLINAIYFKGMWKNKFNKDRTFYQIFYVDKNIQKNVPTMRVTDEIFYKTHEGLGSQIIRLPYQVADGYDPMSMIIILPNWGQTLIDIQNKLNSVTFESLYPTNTSLINLRLPKFMIETKLLLNEHLQKMGIKDAFTSDANFSGITKKNKIFISKVIQQAFIEIDEDGTKATAVTQVEAIPVSADFVEPLMIQVNRPFIVLLATERVILFTGYVNDPTLK